LRHLPPALLFLALAVVMTWPLAYSLGRSVAYPGDPFINTWILDWDFWATFHHPLALFQANAFFPAKDSLAFSENLYGVAIVLFPFRALGMPALMAHNLAMLLGYAFSAFGAYILGFTITRSRIAGIVAGIFYACVPFRFTHLSHVQHVWAGWIPLMLAALIAFARTPTRRTALLFAAAFLMNGLSNVHWLLFGSLAIALTVPILIRSRADLLRLAAPTIVAAALLVPFLLPYETVAKLYNMRRSWRETKSFSAHPKDWLNPGVNNRFYRRFADVTTDPEKWIFPGALSIALSLGAVFVARRDRRTFAIALLWITLGFLGSLGTHAFLHRFLYLYVPGFQAIRVPARWANIAYAGMAMLIAMSVAAMARGRRTWIGGVVAALFLVELHAMPIRWYSTSPNIPRVHRWLKSQKDAAIAELPLEFGQSEFFAMLHATVHHRPMVNGSSGFTPPDRMHLTDLASPVPHDDFLAELRRIGVNTLIVHIDDYGEHAPPMRDWLREELERGHLFYVRHFSDPTTIDGDWVFSLQSGARTNPELETMLRGGYVRGDDTFGVLDYPTFGQQLHKNALFSGWALSPYGIREVNFLFNNGTVRVPARLVEDQGLSRGMPFYPIVKRPRFIGVFDKRPPGVRQDTDVQVEIIDGRGMKTFLEDRYVDWYD
jgi:hypothetical protein